MSIRFFLAGNVCERSRESQVDRAAQAEDPDHAETFFSAWLMSGLDPFQTLAVAEMSTRRVGFATAIMTPHFLGA